jgi:tRNA threonylcarbamoyladenosine biosynthesis protein TsaB
VPTATPPLLLALDTGSPVLSVALGNADGVLAEASTPTPRSSRPLMDLIGRVLQTAGFEARDLAGVAALAGPGSFTGIRIGLATVYGFHHALGIPALGVSTLEALALSVEGEPPTVLAAVDAQRGEWALQVFDRTGGRMRARAPLTLVEGVRLWEESDLWPATAVRVGFDLPPSPEAQDPRRQEPVPLAVSALRLAARTDPATWDTATATAPIYSRPPAATLPKARLA